MSTYLVTGASRGIGKVTVERLARAGHEVIAGVRREEDGAALAALDARIRPVTIDVTNADHVAALADAVPHLDGLVNNAGIVVGGPVQAVSLDELRRVLEVNLVGQIAVTQALLPRLRASRGRIVFVSSLSGRVATAMTGPYNASKFGLEGIADALRHEVHPWGIRVTIVEPAQTDTDMWRTADDEYERTVETLAPEHRELYAKHLAGWRKSIPRSQKMASPADGVAAAIEKGLTAKRPPARIVVGAGPKVQGALASAMPTRLTDALLRTATGVPKKP